jgi:divalent metal cation (Fe/Co/Zn/Cd) transporter
MTDQSENPPVSPTSFGRKLVSGARRLFLIAYAWVFALFVAEGIELRSTSIVEIHEHIRSDPHTLPTVTIALLIGWFFGSPHSTMKTHDNWIYRHPIATQALIGAGLTAMVLVAIFRQY